NGALRAQKFVPAVPLIVPQVTLPDASVCNPDVPPLQFAAPVPVIDRFVVVAWPTIVVDANEFTPPLWVIPPPVSWRKPVRVTFVPEPFVKLKFAIVELGVLNL